MRRLAGVMAGLTVIGAAVVAGYALRAAGSEEEAAPTTIPTTTARVVRTDLVETATLSGDLRFTDPMVIRTQLGGVVTRLPEEATRVGRGDVLFELDGLPVVVLIGERPGWRELAEGIDDGPDVRQLEENLDALGFGEGVTVDEEFDAGGAVEAWREEVGLPEGESVELGRVVFLPRPVRVGALLVDPGETVAPGTPILEVTGLGQEVVVSLDPEDLDLVAEGAPVEVILPDDRRVEGRIASVGRVVRPAGSEPDAPRVVEVIVTLDERVAELDRAPVEVEVESSRVSDVLAVPVPALLALSGGGYYVEVVRGDQIVRVGVDTGEFAGGLVEVSGELAEGDMVRLPE